MILPRRMQETGFRIAVTIALVFPPSTLTPSIQAQDSAAVADSLLLLELEQSLSADSDAGQQPRPARSQLNPDISVIGDIRGWWTDVGDRNFDMEVHEVETAFKSVVDPYARADVYLAIGHEDGEFEFELEEAYVTTLALPYQLQARAGKFRNTFGRINRIHPHALPFIDMPAVYTNFLGDEGLNDQGISVSWLVPNRAFFQELTVEVTRGPAESPTFIRSDDNRLLYTGHLKNFWDLSEDATIEFGVSGAFGPSSFDETTGLAGVDITYKWKPLRRNTYRSFTFQAEGIVSDVNLRNGRSVNSVGMYAMAAYQLSRRWHAILRYDYSDLPDLNDWNETGVAGFLGWYATEFQKIEFGVKTTTGEQLDRMYQGLVRMIFVIGTHGAHEY